MLRRSQWLGVLALLASAASSRSAAALPPDVLQRAQLALERVNQYRQLSGLPNVSLDETLSEGALLHATYLSLNPTQIGDGLAAHDEYPDRPGYTVEGEQAGMNSDISYGGKGADSVDSWFRTYYHRNPILSPGVVRVGYGDQSGGPTGNIIVMQFDSFTGPGDVLSPGHRSAGQATSGQLENPEPTPGFGPNQGNPIIAYFSRSGGSVTWLESNVVSDGVELEHQVIAPNRPSQPRFENNEICLITTAALPADALIEVEIAFEQDGDAKKVAWFFQTSTHGAFDLDEASVQAELPKDRPVIDANEPGGCVCAASAGADHSIALLIFIMMAAIPARRRLA